MTVVNSNTAASPQEMNRFVQSVDVFFANYEKLTTPQIRDEVFASGNPALIANYQSAVSKGAMLSRTIQATVGAWGAAKSAWSVVTGATSTVIGDAIDEIRSWFGYEPAGGVGSLGCPYRDASPISGGYLGLYDPSPISGGRLGALGAIQLPAAAWVAGILGAVYLMNQAMNKIFISVEATRMQNRDPTLSREKALDVAARTIATGGIFGSAGAILPLIAAAALAAFLIFGKKQ